MSSRHKQNLRTLVGRGWDEWVVPSTLTTTAPVPPPATFTNSKVPPTFTKAITIASASVGSRRVSVGPDGNANTLEATTLPQSLMPLFGSYPVDDTISLITCSHCKFRFRTQTADHHTNNCQKRKKSNASGLIRSLDKSTTKSLLKVKTTTSTSQLPTTLATAFSKEDQVNTNNNGSRNGPSSSGNLVPPLILKRAPTPDNGNELDSLPVYKTHTQQQQPKRIQQVLEQVNDSGQLQLRPVSVTIPTLRVGLPVDHQKQPSSSLPDSSGVKKGREVMIGMEKKLVPLKHRRYNPEEHCGVPSGLDGRPCTRSLTCKSHSISLRRSVSGRSKPFDHLLEAYKKTRVDKLKQMDDAAAGTATAAAAPKSVGDGTQTSQLLPKPRPKKSLLSLGDTENLEIVKWSTPEMSASRKYLGSVNSKQPQPITSLHIDRHLGQQQKVLSTELINQVLRSNSASAVGGAGSKDYEEEEEEEECCWASVPLERVRVPRPRPKTSCQEKSYLLEQWKKGEMSELALLEEGILYYQAREGGSGGDERSPSKRLKYPSSHSSASASASSSPEKRRVGAGLVDSESRPPISFKISNGLSGPGLDERTQLTLHGASQKLRLSAPSSRDEKKNVSPQKMTPSFGTSKYIGNSGRGGAGVASSKQAVVGSHGGGRRGGGGGGGGGSDGPVSDSELSNLLAAQFEDLDS